MVSSKSPGLFIERYFPSSQSHRSVSLRQRTGPSGYLVKPRALSRNVIKRLMKNIRVLSSRGIFNDESSRQALLYDWLNRESMPPQERESISLLSRLETLLRIQYEVMLPPRGLLQKVEWAGIPMSNSLVRLWKTRNSSPSYHYQVHSILQIRASCH